MQQQQQQKKQLKDKMTNFKEQNPVITLQKKIFVQSPKLPSKMPKLYHRYGLSVFIASFGQYP